MSNRTATSLLLSTLMIFSSSCSKSQPEPSPIASHRVKLGATRIGEVYQLTGEHPVIAFVDPRAHTVYVAERALGRAKKALNVRTEKDKNWVIGYPALEGEYRKMPLESLDLQQTLYAGMAGVTEKTMCKKSAKGECANMYDGDKFLFSWKPSEDIFMCDYSQTQDCTDIWREVTIKEYPQKDCKGDPTSKKEELPFCNPA